MSETKPIWISRELWLKLRKIVAKYDLSIDDLVELILSDVDLEDYAKELASKASNNAEERAVEEAEEEIDEEEAAEEAE